MNNIINRPKAKKIKCIEAINPKKLNKKISDNHKDKIDINIYKPIHKTSSKKIINNIKIKLIKDNTLFYRQKNNLSCLNCLTVENNSHHKKTNIINNPSTLKNINSLTKERNTPLKQENVKRVNTNPNIENDLIKNKLNNIYQSEEKKHQKINMNNLIISNNIIIKENKEIRNKSALVKEKINLIEKIKEKNLKNINDLNYISNYKQNSSKNKDYSSKFKTLKKSMKLKKRTKSNIIIKSSDKTSSYNNNNNNIIKNIKSNKLIYKKNIFSNNNSNEINEEKNNLITYIMNIYSNWGNSSKISINSIKFYDLEKKEIPVEKASFNMNQPWISKYFKSENKKIFFSISEDYIIKEIEILNGFNDMGIKNIQIFQEKNNKNIWKGIIPKINQITNKVHKIEINNIKINNNSKKFSSINNYNSNTNTIIENKINFNTNNINIDKLKSIYYNFSNFEISSLSSERITKKNIKKNLLNKIINNKSNENINNKENNINDTNNINLPYEICNKIKIFLLSNYGNFNYIGLTGIEFINENDKYIDPNLEFKNYYANKQNLNNLREQRADKHMLNNLFKAKNESNDPNYMFMCFLKNAFIEIEFKNNIKIKDIIFYNYNNLEHLDCCTKEIKIIFYKNNKLSNCYKKIILFKPPGEDGVDFSQKISYPFQNNYNNNIYKNKNLKKLKDYIYNQFYYSPILPSGFILKVEILSNYGNYEYIGIDEIQIINYKMENIINKAKIFFFPDKTILNPQSNPVLFTRYSNINSVNENRGLNRIIFIFDNFFILNKIIIKNYSKYYDIGIKEIKIFIDENIIYEGEIKSNGNITKLFFNNLDNEYIDNENEIIKPYPRYDMFEDNNRKSLVLRKY